MAQKDQSKIRRRRFLSSSSQGPLLRKVYWLILLSLAVQATLVYLITNRQLEAEYVRAHQTIASTLEGLLPWIVGASIIALLTALFGTLKFTLTVAGPTRRLQKHLQSVADGDLSQRIHLRRNDVLRETAEEINQLVMHLEEHIGRLQQTADGLREKALGLEKGKALTEEEISSLHDAVTQLEGVLSGFRTGGGSER